MKKVVDNLRQQSNLFAIMENEPKPVVEQNECLRCGHKWFPNSQQRSVVCPRCKSAWWDRPRKTEEPPKAEATA